ncbi:MAG: hypothetical protein E6K70_00295 [Planctomycetota bacterium]|nr:MAG: hypothetical protein E6K70_00295 [Planctomycetota bacterium]
MQHSWILLVVFVLIWVLNTFLRGNEEERKAGGNRAGGAGGRSGKASAEIDRFLEEVNRRRRQNVERRQAPPSPQPAPVAAPVARGNRGSGTRTPPGRSSIGTQRGRRTEERVAAADVVLTAEPAPDAHVAEDAYRIEPVAAPAVTPAQISDDREPSKALAHLQSLLRSPEGIRNAVLLRVILGEPSCRRHGLR